jgi:hypothetical protein
MTAEAARVEIDAHELAMLLEGLEAATARSATRWNPPFATAEAGRVAG